MRMGFIFLVILAGSLAGNPAFGGGWAKNYGDALKVSSDTGRPMLVLFCPDETKVINAERKRVDGAELAHIFVLFLNPVKIANGQVSDPLLNTFLFGLMDKGQKEMALKGKGPPIQFPVIVFAEGSGKPLYKMEGAQTSASLLIGMKTALIKNGPVPDPHKASEAAAAVRRADVLFEKQEFGPAARLYREAAETNLKTPPVAVAKEKLAKIEDMANKELAAARSDLNDKAYPEAIEKLFAVDRKFPTVKAGQEAHAELAKLHDLPEAKEAYAAAEKKGAGTASDTAVAAKLPAGPPLDPFTEEDLVALDEMASPQTAQAATPGTDDADECRKLFNTAQTYLDNKEPARAKPLLQKIVQQYPKTIYADQAKTLLEEMGK